MSIQIFVEGKFAPKGEFLRPLEGRNHAELLGRHLYLSMVGEVIPRTLLDHLGLSKMLLGASSGSSFLLLLPQEFQAQTEAFLRSAASNINQLSNGELDFNWAITENLGDWSIVRKRLFEEMQRGMGTKATPESFIPVSPDSTGADQEFFSALANAAPTATSVGVDDTTPARFQFGESKFTYKLGYEMDSLPWTAHLDLSSLKRRKGAAMTVAVDALEIRLRRANSVEEHLRLSHLYKNFFAGELQTLLLRLPDCTGKIAIIDSGVEGFTVYGDVDALLKVAQEIHRLFQTMAEVNLNETAGVEGKSITAALAAGEQSTAVAEVHAALKLAQASSRDSIFMFGRVLDWKQVPDALEIRELCLRMIRNYGASPQFVSELSAFFRESGYQSLRRKTGRFERPWRLYRRLSLALETENESRDFERTRNRLLAEFIGKNAGQTRLRPSGRVGLELTRISINA
jgi:CRISPR-associated protein Csm1